MIFAPSTKSCVDSETGFPISTRMMSDCYMIRMGFPCCFLHSQFSRARWRWFGDSNDQRSDSDGSGRDSFDVRKTDGLHRTRHFSRFRLDRESDFPTLPFPICIVGTGEKSDDFGDRGKLSRFAGTTNTICHSIYGTTDATTSILHLLCSRKHRSVLSHHERTNALILDKQMKIDMSAVFDIDDHFLTANFGAAAGYPANALKYFSRYSTVNQRKMVQKSFARAATNKNLK